MLIDHMPGDAVRIHGNDAIVRAVQVVGVPPHLSYQLTWWEDSTRYCEWVEADELLKLEGVEKTVIARKKKGTKKGAAK